MTVITRFAPSPNGLLHLGHAYSALFSQDWAKRHGGRFLPRIEDIDFTRTREEYVQAIFDDLSWLGLEWEEPVRRQSRHMDEYRRRLEDLKKRGLVYPCFCSRKAIAEHIRRHPDWPRTPEGAPLYPGTCRQLSPEERQERLARGERPAWRLDMKKALASLGTRAKTLSWQEEGSGPHGERGRIPADPARFGDVILGRRDIVISYHLAVVHDDALQGITHVTRGQDLFHATGLHRLLQELFALPAPVYVHHSLITDEGGRKLSKRFRDRALSSLRKEGVSPESIKRLLGF